MNKLNALILKVEKSVNRSQGLYDNMTNLCNRIAFLMNQVKQDSDSETIKARQQLMQKIVAQFILSDSIIEKLNESIKTFEIRLEEPYAHYTSVLLFLVKEANTEKNKLRISRIADGIYYGMGYLERLRFDLAKNKEKETEQIILEAMAAFQKIKTTLETCPAESVVKDTYYQQLVGHVERTTKQKLEQPLRVIKNGWKILEKFREAFEKGYNLIKTKIQRAKNSLFFSPAKEVKYSKVTNVHEFTHGLKRFYRNK